MLTWCMFVLMVRFTSAQVPVSRLIQTSQGPIRGYKAPDYNFYVFYNIPYATAPTGPDKFKAARPPPVWVEPFEAVNKDVICHQFDVLGLKGKKHMQEQCLIANVYTPAIEKINLPVVVYVHGGAYQTGYGEYKPPNNLMTGQNIIAVTFNYRLGIHGFLCLGTEGVPGNAGIKDQLALLRWVKKNIVSFGGNPDDITVDGYSSGSSAVDLLMLSKTTNGLFKKAICESGANVGVWSVQLDPLKNAQDYAKKLNFINVEDVYALEKFYKNASFEVLTSETSTLLARPDSSFVFVPCIERDTGVEMFLEDSPVNILKEGKYNKLPLLYGFTNMEGLMRVPWDFYAWKNRMNNNFSDFLAADLQFDNNDQKELIAQKIKHFYFAENDVSEESILGFVNYFTDVLFAYPMLRSVKLQVAAGNDKIYLYEYSFTEGGSSSAPLNISGAGHNAQNDAILDIDIDFSNNEDENGDSEDYKKMRAVLREIWLNFIINGEPVPTGSSLPTWPVTGTDGSPHMSLDRTLKLCGPLLQNRIRFWDDIYRRHYRAPVPPPPPSPAV